MHKRFLAEAPKAWKQQQEFFSTLEGDNRTETKFRPGAGEWKITPGRVVAKTSNNFMLDQHELFESGSWAGTAVGVNSMYMFKLKRSSDAKPWAITEVKKMDDAIKKHVAARKEVCLDLLLAPTIPLLPYLIQQKGFRCVKVDAVSDKGEQLARVQFVIAAEGKSRLKGGWFTLAPSRYWVIRDGEVELDIRGKGKGVDKWVVRNDYHDGPDNHPIAKKNVLHNKVWENGQFVSETVYTNNYGYHARPSIPESEFTLSAYGLPEPDGGEQKNSFLYLWFGLLGVVCLIIGASIRRYGKRRPNGAT